VSTTPSKGLKIPVVPLDLCGKWIAWNAEHTEIVASENSIEQLWQVVHDLKIHDPVFEKVPRADIRFVGMR
jgi:hypothetical protein